MTQAASNGGDGKRRVPKSVIAWPKGQAPEVPPESPPPRHTAALEPASQWTRIVYLAALFTVLAPLALGGLGMAGTSSVFALSALLSALMVATGIWRAVQVIRDRWRLSSPPMARLHRLARSLALWLMSLGAIVLVLRLLATPITPAVLGGARTESGAEFFVVGMVLALFAGLAPAGLLLFELSRLSAFELAAREQRP